jgi:polyphosphate kinase
VVTPVDDVAAQKEVAAAFDALLADTASSWDLAKDGQWHRVQAKKDDKPRSAQSVLMRRARRRYAVARSH